MSYLYDLLDIKFVFLVILYTLLAIVFFIVGVLQTYRTNLNNEERKNEQASAEAESKPGQ